MIRIYSFLTALGLMLAGPAVADVPNRAATESIIHDYILAHPEIIPEALQVLEQRQQAEAINANRKAIETPFGNEVEGNPHGDVTLVEFFDYNCGYCRASVADVTRLLAEDKMLRVVYREIPVLGAESDNAAVVSLRIAQHSPNWADFHRAVYAAGDASEASLLKIQHSLGATPPSPAQLKAPELRSEINRNLDLAQALKISGTPSWVVGDKLLSGAVGYDALKKAIAETRRTSQH